MKNVLCMTAILLLMTLVSGCSILEPGYSSTKVIVEKDADGKIVKSTYYRSSLDLSGRNDSLENANSWASADNMARSSQGVGGQGLAEASVVIANKSSHLVMTKISGPVERTYMLDGNQQVDDSIPIGSYSVATYRNGERLASGTMKVRPEEPNNYLGKKVGGFTVYQ